MPDFTNYEQELRNGEDLSARSSNLPDFPGRMLAYNGNSGKLGILVPGEFDKTEQIDSIKFISAFVMKRLKYFTNNGKDSVTSSYVVGKEKMEYRMVVDGVTHTAATKKDMVASLGLENPKDLQMQTIFIGFAAQINGTKLNAAEPIWYVSKGVNAALLNEEIEAQGTGKLNTRTMIKLIANRTEYANTNGGTNIVLDFEVDEVPDDRVQGMAEFVTKDGANFLMQNYYNEMVKAMNGYGANGDAEHQSSPAESNPFGGGEIIIDDDDLPF